MKLKMPWNSTNADDAEMEKKTMESAQETNERIREELSEKYNRNEEIIVAIDKLERDVSHYQHMHLECAPWGGPISWLRKINQAKNNIACLRAERTDLINRISYLENQLYIGENCF